MAAPSYLFENYSSTGEPAVDFITKIEARLTDAGWVFVEQVLYTIAGPVNRLMRVWKNPSTLNAAGADFYIGLVRTNANSQGYFAIRAFEGWNTTSKTLQRPVLMQATNQLAVWTSLVFANSQFVALSSNIATLGYSSYAATSSDGINWTARRLPYGAGWVGLTYGAGTWVAVNGFNTYGNTGTAHASATGAYSTDNGVTWTANTMPSSVPWSCTAYGGGVFVALSNPNGAAASSTDGITWTSRTSASSAAWNDVCYGAGTFVAVATGTATAQYSTNGTTWTSSTMPASGAWTSVAYGNSTFVAVQNGGTAAATSANGTTWTARTLPASANWAKVIFANGLFIASAASTTAANNYIATSPDGITWTLAPSTPNGASTINLSYTSMIAAGAGLYVILSGITNNTTPVVAATHPDVTVSGAWTNRGIAPAYPLAPGDFSPINPGPSTTFAPATNTALAFPELTSATLGTGTNYDIGILASKSYLALAIQVNGTVTDTIHTYVGLYAPAFSDSQSTNLPLCIATSSVTGGVSRSIRIPLDATGSNYATSASITPESILLGSHTGGGVKEPVTQSIRGARAALIAGPPSAGFAVQGGLRGWLYDCMLVATTGSTLKVADTVTIGATTWTGLGYTSNASIYAAGLTFGMFYNTASGS